jgi:hypothetical protein
MDRAMHSPQGQVLDSVLKLVRNETGHAMYSEISEILTASAAAAGLPKETDFTQDRLKVRWRPMTSVV